MNLEKYYKEKIAQFDDMDLEAKQEFLQELFARVIKVCKKYLLIRQKQQRGIELSISKRLEHQVFFYMQTLFETRILDWAKDYFKEKDFKHLYNLAGLVITNLVDKADIQIILNEINEILVFLNILRKKSKKRKKK